MTLSFIYMIILVYKSCGLPSLAHRHVNVEKMILFKSANPPWLSLLNSLYGEASIGTAVSW